MNIQLRKRHRRMWWTVFIVIGIAISAAIKNIPVNPIADISMNYCPIGMSTCTSDHEVYNADDLFVWHTTKGDQTTIISLDLMKPLKSAFTTVHLEGKEPSVLLGQINEMKSYSFEVPDDLLSKSERIEVRDGLKNIVFTAKSINELN